MKIKNLFLIIFIFVNFQQLQSQVTANFSASDTAICNPATVAFTDQSTGNIESWQWQFSNGQSSVLQNPVITFTGSGFYSVTLIVTETGTGDTDTMTVDSMIHVVTNPHASFQVGSNNMGCIPLDITVTDLSVSSDGNITSWSWDMGDGTILSVQNPTHTYTSPGVFSIYLQVVNEYGCMDDTVITDAVHASSVPEIYISADITQYCSVPIDIHFTNNSTGSATQTDFFWNFGDGNTSTTENPVNTYTVLGDYDIIFSVVDEYGCSNTDTFPDFIHLNQITADFSYSSSSTSPDTACLGESVTFTNNSGIYCSWFFGDGTSALNVYNQDIMHTYTQPGTYTVVLIAAPGDLCADTISKDIYIQQVTASFIANQTIDCKVPFTVNFTDQSSSNVTQWYWDFSDGNTSNLQNPSNTYTDFGNYDISLLVTTNAGCSMGINLTDYIQINPPEVSFTVDPPDGGCVPITLTFTGSSTSSSPVNDWQWTFQGGNPSTASGIVVTSDYNTDGTYMVTLTITNDSNCTATYTDSVSLGTHQTPNFYLPNDTVCASDTMTFYNLSQDTSLIQDYNWGFSTEFQPEAYYIYNDGVANDTGFTDIELITNYNGCKDTLHVDSALYVKGPIITNITPLFNCDTPYMVTFVADIIDGENWDWDFGDGNTVINSMQDTIVHTYSASGSYWVKVNAHNSARGCDFIDSILITITDLQAVFSMPHENCDGDTVLLNGAGSIDASSYYFDFGDGTNSGWNANPYNIHTFGSGVFIVTFIAEDIHACRDTVIDTLISSNPVAHIVVDTMQGCAPCAISFNGDSSSSIFGLISYYWNFMDGTSATDTNIVHTFVSGGQYNVQLTVYDSLGCHNTAIQPISIFQPQAQIVPEDTTLCVGVPVIFYGNDTTYNYQWDLGNGQVFATDTVTAVYWSDTVFTVQLVALDGHGCLDTAYQQVDVQGIDININVLDSIISCYVTTPLTTTFIENHTDTAYDAQWLWDFGDGTYSTNYNPAHYYSYPDMYYVLLQAVTAYGCMDEDTVLLNVQGPYAVFDLSFDTLCKGETFTIAISDTMNVASFNGTLGDGNAFTSLPYNYAYNTTGMMEININIFSESSHQCGLTLSDSVYVIQVNAYFDVFDAHNDTASCSPLTVNFTDSSQGATSWDWDFGDGQTYSGALPSSHTYTNPNVQDQIYTITLAIADQNGCVDTAEHQVLVYGTPSIDVSPDQLICKGDSIFLSANSTVASGNPYFIWSPSEGLNNPYIATPLAFPDTSTLYTVNVYSQNVCTNLDSVLITVQNEPLVTYSQDTTIVIGDIADLFIYANQASVSFLWTPSYGLNCINCEDVYAQPLETTTYHIEYEDSSGCFVKSVNITVFVDEKYSLDLPSAFTPNNDGKNDIVYVKGWGIKKLLEFSVFNRWGEKIFTTDNINTGWDGTFKGKPQNIDTYVYYVKVELYSGKEIEKKGTINLFR